jgi:single-strand DNA-binding protein
MILSGLARLGADAEIRYTISGEPVAKLRLAFNYGQKDSDGNRPAQWVEASMFGKRAEALARYLTKGTAIDVIIADPHIETWTKQDKTTGHKLVGRVLEIEFAGGGRDAGSGQSGGKTQQSSDAPSRPAAPASGFNDIDYDIPF